MSSISPFWSPLTDLGDSSFLVPAALLLAIYVYRSEGGAKGAAHWLLVFGGCGFGVFLSKVAFQGWQLGIPALGFRGFSGHSALAGVFFPVAGFVAMGQGERASRAGLVAGLVLAVVVGVSRIALGAHSVSEAASGLSLGLLASAAYLRRPLRDQADRTLPAQGRLALMAGLGLLLVGALCDGRAPTTALTVSVAQELRRVVP